MSDDVKVKRQPQQRTGTNNTYTVRELTAGQHLHSRSAK